MLTQITESLWNVVNNSYVYSFKKEPLMIFHLLVKKYMEKKEMCEFELPKEWQETLDELENVQSTCAAINKDLLHEFESKLDEFESADEKTLCDIVDFFVQKYAELNAEEGGEYILPKELVNLIYWYAVDFEACTTDCAIYNPFAGLCSYGVEHADGLNFQLQDSLEGITSPEEIQKEKDFYSEYSWYHGVESNQINRLIGSVRLLVHNPTNLEQMYIHADDSIKDDVKNLKNGWTFIATPPIGSKDISDEVLEGMYRKLVDKFIKAEGMRDAFFIFPKEFCVSSSYSNMRRDLVDCGYVDAVIELPSSVFAGNIEVVLVHLRKPESHWPNHAITFANLTCWVNENDNSIFERLDKFWFGIVFDNEATPFHDLVTPKVVSENDYCLLPSLYISKERDKKPGEIKVRLGEFFSSAKSEEMQEGEGLFIAGESFHNDSKMFFETVRYDKFALEDEFNLYKGQYLVITYLREKLLLCKTSENAVFCLDSNQFAFKFDESTGVSFDYVVNCLLRDDILQRLALSISLGRGFKKTVCENILAHEIAIHLDKSVQISTMQTLREEYERVRDEEERAEKARAAHREVSSDISHMLGTTFSRIGEGLSDLREIEGAEDAMTQIKDSIEHMRRLIDSVGKDFSDARMKQEEYGVNDFFGKYCEAWKNFGKNTFELQYHTSVDDEASFLIDTDFMKVLLDAILDNAYRHGFERFWSSEHQVSISSSYVSMDNRNYVLLSIANNGKPLPEGFSLSRYISRGEFVGETGRTGLGGNHIYSIVKRHGGFLNLTSTPEWSMVIEILLPIEFYNENESSKFVAYGNAKECM